MRRRILLLCLASGSVLPFYAQSKKLVTTFDHYGPVLVKKPVMIDDKDVNQKEFSGLTVLQKSHDLSNGILAKTVLSADTAGYVVVDITPEGFAVNEYTFSIQPDRYCKGTLKVTSPSILAVYQDGKLINTKSSAQDSLNKQSEITVPLTLQNKNYEYKIRTVSERKDKAETPRLSVAFEPDSKFETVDLVISNNQNRKLNLQDLMTGERIGGVTISPSGKYGTVRVSTTFKDGKSASENYLIDLQTNKKIAVLDGSRNSANWLPVSDKLYFTKRGMDGTQLWLMNPADLSEEMIVASLPEGGFSFAPTEDFLIVNQSEKAPADLDKDFRRFITPNDRQSYWRYRNSLYKYDLNTGAMERLTFGAHSASLNDISEDGKFILFGSSREDFKERPFNVSSMYLMNLATNKVDTLWSDVRYGGGAKFSPNGKTLLVQGSPEAFDGIGLDIEEGQMANTYDSQIFLFDLATKKTTPIAKNFDPTIESAKWINDDQIAVMATDKDLVRPYLYSVSKNKYEVVPVEEDVLRGFNISKNGKNAIYTGQSVSNFSSAYVMDMKNKKSKCLIDASSERLKGIELGKVEDWNFIASDGNQVDGRYYLPSDFDATKKYPMIVYYYGGTTPTSKTMEHPYPAHLYAANGYVVLVLNPSGTIGWGQKMSARHVNAWGKRTAEDIIEGTKKFCADNSFVDASKIGCIGASYGGFMTQYLQTQTDIFAAAISHAGISALSSYWGEGYWGYAYSTAASADSYPWNNPELYTKQSPLFQADKVKTPILFLHGSVDTNVPVGESIQMYTALKLLGKPVEMIEVQGEDHGIADFNKKIKWTNSILAWFDRYLKEQPEWWKSMYPDTNLQ
ncbi:MAG: prolyl oligopeptidase family serine peptidase [Bacteroidales bacterium]